MPVENRILSEIYWELRKAQLDTQIHYPPEDGRHRRRLFTPSLISSRFVYFFLISHDMILLRMIYGLTVISSWEKKTDSGAMVRHGWTLNKNSIYLCFSTHIESIHSFFVWAPHDVYMKVIDSSATIMNEINLLSTTVRCFSLDWINWIWTIALSEY